MYYRTNELIFFFTMPRYDGIIASMQRASQSLVSVTGLHSNAILYFSQGNGTLTIDSSGNYSLSNVSTIQVKAKLRQPTRKASIDVTQNPGQDTNRTYMEGYLVEPLNLDGYFPDFVKCEIEENNIKVLGKFTFKDDIPSALKEKYKLQIASGQKICGHFERNAGSL